MTSTRNTAMRVCAVIALSLLVGCFTASADSRRAVLSVAPTNLALTAAQGGGSVAGTVSVTNTGVGSLRWTAASLPGAAWLSFSPGQGTGAATVTVSASPTGLGAGVYQGTLRFTQSTGATIDVQVVLTVSAAPAANTPPTVQLTAPVNGAPFTAPATIALSATASDSDGIARVDFFAGTSQVGSTTTSPYAVSWTNVAVGTYVITAVATDTLGAKTTSAASTITVSSSSNPPPTVSITAPANGATFTAPATITVSANASDSDGVARVDFFAGTSLIGSTTTSPYAVSWTNVAAGTYAITAIATDTLGAKTTSAASTVTVSPGSSNPPPTVSITAPANGATYAPPAPITVTASASDSNGQVARVDFYANGVRIGTATANPFTVAWTNAAAGNYSITATATDSAGAQATSAPITVTVSTPVYDYVIPAGGDIQSAVNAYPQGARFLLKAGLYRMQTIVPKTGQSFTGEPGAIMSGARLLTSFARSGSYWLATGQTQWGPIVGQCESAWPGCSYSNDLFFDDVPLKRVLSLSAVAPGTWYLDDASDTLYFADDPTGHRVEASVTTAAFQGTASNVVISNLIIEKYANAAQTGAIVANSTSGWVLQNNEVRYNHGLGAYIGNATWVLNNHFHHNGQMGLGGGWGGSNQLVQGNEINANNTAHFDTAWEAGGTKFCDTNYLVVRGNYSHDNRGPGLWTDIDNINTTVEQNTVENNTREGIYHEISYAAVIRYNTVRGNGTQPSSWMWNSGIAISASPNVEVYGNLVENNFNGIGALQQSRGTGAYGPHEISNLWVHDNTVRMTSGYTGLAQEVGDTTYFTSRNNRFDRNTYYLGTNSAYFAWMNAWIGETAWKGYGQDVNGTFIR